jgi:hypothetical protein
VKVNYQSHDHEHEFEAVPGLPEPLPKGERLLWQGGPDWRTLAVEALHIRKLAIYFALMLGWRLSVRWSDGAGFADALIGTLPMAALAVLALGLTATIAWLSARTSVYTVTDRRVVMRIGIVLTVTFNLPLSRIESASLHRLAAGYGDIALALEAGENIAYLHLWPHARPWRLKRTEPMLRSLVDAERVAGVLATALATSAGQTRTVMPVAPASSRDQAPGAKPMLAA